MLCRKVTKKVIPSLRSRTGLNEAQRIEESNQLGGLNAQTLRPDKSGRSMTSNKVSTQQCQILINDLLRCIQNSISQTMARPAAA